MILTENDAMEKWCHRTMTPRALRREEDLFCTETCTASDCMAWRWASDPDGRPVMKQVAPPSECPDCKGKGVLIDPVNDALPGCSTCDGSGKVGHYERMGFCGLAGEVR